MNISLPEKHTMSLKTDDREWFGTGFEIWIGRKPDILQSENKHSCIIFEDRRIGRLHAIFIYVGGNWFLMDNYSLNGTWINSEKLDPNKPTMVKNGDEIKIAFTSFTFCSYI